MLKDNPTVPLVSSWRILLLSMGNGVVRFPGQHVDEPFRLWLANVHRLTFYYLSKIRQMWYGRKVSCELLNSSVLGVQNRNLCIWAFIVQTSMHLHNYVRGFVLWDLCFTVQ